MMDRLNLCDFGIRPGMDDDASPAFAVVLAACREQRVSHLRIEPGIYHIRNARAEALMQRVLNGELGHNPRTHRVTQQSILCWTVKECRRTP